MLGVLLDDVAEERMKVWSKVEQRDFILGGDVYAHEHAMG